MCIYIIYTTPVKDINNKQLLLHGVSMVLLNKYKNIKLLSPINIKTKLIL